MCEKVSLIDVKIWFQHHCHATRTLLCFLAFLDGEIEVSGMSVFSHYHNNPDADAQSFTPDGWFCIGDISAIGKKVFYDEILLFNKTQNQWQTIGKLPKATTYGVSVAIPNGYL